MVLYASGCGTDVFPVYDVETSCNEIGDMGLC